MSILNFIKKYIFIVFTFLLVSGFSPTIFAQSPPISSTLSLGSNDYVATGDSLPVYVQLLNFGTPGEKIDVLLNFIVLNQKEEIVIKRTETVAVQTTASFTRYLQIPESIPQGNYILKLDVSYAGQRFPAISEQTFIVEYQFLGYGLSKWYQALPFGFLPLLLLIFYYKRKQKDLNVQRDYSHIPDHERTNYEIIHDIVNSIHYHVGDKQIHEIAERIPGLTLNTSNSHIKEIKGPMENIVSQLIHEYEGITGKKPNIISNPSYPKKRIQTH